MSAVTAQERLDLAAAECGWQTRPQPQESAIQYTRGSEAIVVLFTRTGAVRLADHMHHVTGQPVFRPVVHHGISGRDKAARIEQRLRADSPDWAVGDE